MELDGAYARAAAIAIFNLRLRYAIDILNRGAIRQPQLAVIAMALSGTNYFFSKIEPRNVVKQIFDFFRIFD